MTSTERGARPVVRFEFHGCYETRSEAERVSSRVGGTVTKFRRVPGKGSTTRPEGHSYRVTRSV